MVGEKAWHDLAPSGVKASTTQPERKGLQAGGMELGNKACAHQHSSSRTGGAGRSRRQSLDGHGPLCISILYGGNMVICKKRWWNFPCIFSRSKNPWTSPGLLTLGMKESSQCCPCRSERSVAITPMCQGLLACCTCFLLNYITIFWAYTMHISSLSIILQRKWQFHWRKTFSLNFI